MARPMASLCLVWDRFVFQMLASMSAEFCFYVFWAVPTLLTFVSDQHNFLFCCGIHLIKTWLKNSMPQTVHTRIFNVEYKDTFMIVYVFSFRFVFFVELFFLILHFELGRPVLFSCSVGGVLANAMRTLFMGRLVSPIPAHGSPRGLHFQTCPKKNAPKTRKKTVCPQMLMTTEPKRWPSHSAKNTNERYETTVFQLDFSALTSLRFHTRPVHGQWPGQRPAIGDGDGT